MVFSSLAFLHLFLPSVLAAYFVAPHRARNALLLLASITFYASGEGWYTAIMLLSIVGNYGFGVAIEAKRDRRGVLALAVAFNLALLITFKYLNFIIGTVQGLVPAEISVAIALAPVHLPIGISFFTFQGISYVVDVARGEIRAQRSLIAYGMYKAFFPQLIAGPIVRYRDVADAMGRREIALADVAAGIERFVIGLAKKVLIANTLAGPADLAFSTPASSLGAGFAWYGAVCYALQIYFDFSGYSDMAIGLGRMFGFRFPENFVHPYAARSVREFWRRWHISLSSWFRDYLYIPLGGGRAGPGRTARNLLIVFVLCGLWHGASWTFLVWGLWHGTFLAAEHFGLSRPLDRLPGAMQRLYLALVVVLGWVWFRADDLDAAMRMFAAMFALVEPESGSPWWQGFSSEIALALAAGAVGASGVCTALMQKCTDALPAGMVRPWLAVKLAVLIGLLVLCSVMITASTLNPFIYFRF